ncbi:MAG: serine/threonine-protein kinase [Elainellaceae cyanobacterium]
MAGQILGERYRVEKQLGHKAGRWTLLATDVTTEQAVVLKLISIDEELHPDSLRLFERELNTLQHLKHPSIPRYLESFDIELPRDKTALVLVESYIEGTSTDKYLQQGRTFSEIEIKHIATGILEVLVYLHSQSPPILHRDIKPSSIMLATRPGERTQLYLVNFGSVKPIAPSYNCDTVLTLVSTQGYIAPEQLGGKALERSDLYSLGMTLMALMTGCTPDKLPCPPEMDIKAQDLSPQFAVWLKHLTDSDPHCRPPSAQIALEALG